MPEIGEVKSARELGIHREKYWQKYIFHACVDCGHGIWVQLQKARTRSLRCRSCSKKGKLHPLYGHCGERSARWKGGQYIHSDGYVMVQRLEHPRSSYGYIKRAILILEQKLGRPMFPNTECHHINGLKDDDRPENLQELTKEAHASLHNYARARSGRGYFLNEPIIAVNTK